MPSQKVSNAVQRTILGVVLTFLLSTGVLLAHGNEKHVMGTVTAISPDAITVDTAANQVTVQITKETKFVRSGNPSSVKDLKVGDRVVIHAKRSGEKLTATEVKSGGQPKAGVSKK